MSLGNHEFDNGISGLTPFIKNLNCPVLAANLVLDKEPMLQAEHNLMKSVLFNINGTKVGVIGYLTPLTKVLSKPNDIIFVEEVTAIREEAEKLKKSGINVLIALGHSGIEKDIKIAEEVEDIDLVIGGHSNTFLWNGANPDIEKPDGSYPIVVERKTGRIALVVQAYAYTKYFGRLKVLFDLQGEIINFAGNSILLDNNISQDSEIVTIVERYREGLMGLLDVVIGNTSVVLDGQSCRLQECNLGNLITDAMVNKYASEYDGEGWTDTPIAIIQGGGIRSSIKHFHLPTKITRGDLISVMPFEGNLVKLTLNGSVLWDILENSVANYRKMTPPGKYLQVSGLRVEYDFQREPGSRVVKVHTLCGKCEIPVFKPINKNTDYNILTTYYLYMGGDGYTMMKHLMAKQLNYSELESTIEYIQRISPIHTAVEGRIINQNINKLANFTTIIQKY